MKRFLLIFILYSTFTLKVNSQVNIADSTFIIGLWYNWNLATSTPPSCVNNFNTLPATQWCNINWDSTGRCFGLEFGINVIPGGILPSTIDTLSELEYIYLPENPNLTGNIPPEIGSFTNLKRLEIYGCGFTGNIPSEIGNLSNLDILWIGNAGLTGMIPQTFQNLNKMTSFVLSNSGLKGELSGYFGLLDTLQQINIIRNHEFSSIIPDSICLSNSIQYLFLQDNLFHGTIPPCLGYMPTLTTIDISHNNFTGSIPQSLFPPASNNIEITADSNDLTGLPFIPQEHALPAPYYWLNMRIHDVRWNKLQFGDFENTYLNGCSYCIDGPIAPQDSVWSSLDTTVLINTTVTLNSTVTGQYNTYYWYKNGVLIDSTYNGLLVIPNIQHSDSGVYTCNVTNQYITPLLFQGGGGLHLILNRYPVKLHVVNSLASMELSDVNNMIEISPNPSNGIFNVSVSNSEQIAKVEITDLLGRQVYLKEQITDKNDVLVDINQLAGNTYILTVTTESAVYTAKVLLMK